MGLAESIRETYQQAAKEVDKKTKDFWARHKAKAEKKLQDVASGKISMDDYKRWLSGQVFIGERWKEKLDDITRTYVEADEKAREIINKTDKNVFVRFANAQGNDIKSHIAGYSFDLYDKHTVERLLKEDPKMLPEWKINEPKDYTWNEKRVKNEIMQGIIQGEDIPSIAKRLSSGLATDNHKKMNMFARTAVTGAQNAGRMERLHEAQDMGVVVKKKWLAAHDNRVRDAHAYLDGQTVEVDEDFITEDGQKISFPGDPSAPPELVYNCRCTLVYVYDVKASAANLKGQEESAEEQTVQNVASQTTTKPENRVQSNAPEIAGVKCGKPMTHEQADSGAVNPNFSYGGGFTINCQSCVVTYEARLRGYNVEVVANNASHPMCEKLSRDSRLAYKNKDGSQVKYLFSDDTDWTRKSAWKDEIPNAKRFEKKLLSELDESGRYTLEFKWRGYNAGHIVTIKKDAGELTIYDPQSDRTYKGKEVSSYLERLQYERTYHGWKYYQWPGVMRVDDKDFNVETASGIMVEKKG